jgi:hypothetical protein
MQGRTDSYENCYAYSCEKTLLIHKYRQRIEDGLGIFEKPPENELPLEETDSILEDEISILTDKKFKRAVFAFIRKFKKVTLLHVRRSIKMKYSIAALRYFFDWCVEHQLLYEEEVVHQSKQKICYYYVR